MKPESNLISHLRHEQVNATPSPLKVNDSGSETIMALLITIFQIQIYQQVGRYPIVDITRFLQHADMTLFIALNLTPFVPEPDWLGWSNGMSGDKLLCTILWPSKVEYQFCDQISLAYVITTGICNSSQTPNQLEIESEVTA